MLVQTTLADAAVARGRRVGAGGFTAGEMRRGGEGEGEGEGGKDNKGDKGQVLKGHREPIMCIRPAGAVGCENINFDLDGTFTFLWRWAARWPRHVVVSMH